MRNPSISRRRFLAGLAAAGPVGSVMLSRPAMAEDLPKLSLDDPLAVGLMYVEDATQAKGPTYQAGQKCSNCLQVQGNDGDAYRPCAIIPGKAINANGWCSAWVAKPS